MQPEYKCIFHPQNQLLKVCLNSKCQQSKLLCEECSKEHEPTHNTIPFHTFKDTFIGYRKIINQNIQSIKDSFFRLKQAFNLCINRAEQRAIKNMNKLSAQIFKYDLKDLEIQQFYGVTDTLLQNLNFQDLLLQNKLIDCKQQYQRYLEQQTIKIQNLQSSIMVNINQYASKCIMAGNSQIRFPQKNMLSQKPQFKFSAKMKSDFLSVSDTMYRICRDSIYKQGLTVYAIVDRPLQKQQKITFKILRQTVLYMYFGVCDPNTFQIYNFEGRVYEKGNKMYSIRQNHDYNKKRAVTLHNSMDQYSNKEIVPWDIKLNDTITLSIKQGKGSIPELIFIKNYEQKFIMPLDHKIKTFYPFVGLKSLGDQIAIIDDKNSYLDDKVYPKSIDTKIENPHLKQKKNSWFFK